MKLNSKNISGFLLLLLGVFSTLQIFELFNLTIFTILLITTSLYFLFTHRINLKLSAVMLLVFCLITTALTFINADFIDKYRLSALVAFVNISLVILIYLCIKDKDEISNFFKGFKISCGLQIGWCLLQIICSELSNFDLNSFVFNTILHMEGEFSSYRNGKVVCTGLHWHAANLIPVLLFVYLTSDKKIFKIICLIIAIFSRNATLLVAMGLCFMYSIFCCLKCFNKPIRLRIKPLNLLIAALVITLILFNLKMIREKASDTVVMFINRLLDINSTEEGSSSAVHFHYYTALPEIFSKNTLISKLFGVGVSCSGAVFSKFFNQYNEMTWVVESDFINILLSQGIIGFVCFYYIFIKIALQIRKVNKKMFMFMLIIFICGITYNVQFYWTIMLELFIYLGCRCQYQIDRGSGINGIECNHSHIQA